MYFNWVLEKCPHYVKCNGFYDILNVQIDFKYNDIYMYTRQQYIILLHRFYICISVSMSTDFLLAYAFFFIIILDSILCNFVI